MLTLPPSLLDNSSVLPDSPLEHLVASADRIAWSFAAWPGLPAALATYEDRKRYFLGVLADLLDEEGGELVSMLAQRDELVPALREMAGR